MLKLLFPIILIASGCNSCQQTPELPAPVPQEGRLPRAVEPQTSPQAVELPPPSCAVVGSAIEEEGVAPFEVHLSAEGMCTDADGNYMWDFGDGSEVVHDANAVHVYAKPGTYEAQVTLEDPEHNAKDTDEVSITVTAD